MNILESLLQDHARARLLLDVLEEQLTLLPGRDESTDFATIGDVMTYMHQYADRFHHPREHPAFHFPCCGSDH